MPFSKFEPFRGDDDDPLAATDESAARRAFLLKWGMVVTQAMVLLGIGVMLGSIATPLFRLVMLGLGGVWLGQLLGMVGLSRRVAWITSTALAVIAVGAYAYVVYWQS